MGRYKILFRKSVVKDLRPIPNKDLQKILAAIESLSDDPRPAGMEKLSSQDRCRLRRGNYRILYEIKDNEIAVIVVKVGHRRDVYRRSK
jgi:mRNA interferase RelE/StbE